MGLKVDSSFLKYLSMGALATQRVMQAMRDEGLRPIELERYSSTNKIWSTKVKRLRLPDLLCVHTGARVEVRAKSDLCIKMSDAPSNVDRRWHSGLRPCDLVAFVHCHDANGKIAASGIPQYFTVEDLASSEGSTRLGQPKSADEGSERDREWPSVVASNAGTVLEVTDERIRTQLDSGRKQSYQLKGKTPYVAAGARFLANSQFLAGVPARMAALAPTSRTPWDPRPLAQGNALDQYVCAKALGAIGARQDVPLLEKLERSAEHRTALEAAGSLAKLGLQSALDLLRAEIASPRLPFLRMEAVFLLTELVDSPLRADAESTLAQIAIDATLDGDEVRQAAIWGLGMAGMRRFDLLLPLLAAENIDERVHAMIGLGAELPIDALKHLVKILADPHASAALKASASYVLSMVTADSHVPLLVELATTGEPECRAWGVATLGSLATELEADELPSDLAAQVQPLRLLSPSRNWTRAESGQQLAAFLSKQSIFCNVATPPAPHSTSS